MRPFVFYFFIAASASAQIVSVGVRAGVPLTQAVNGNFSGPTQMLDTGRWTIGPTIEFRLPFGFSVGVDALYRGYREQFSGALSEIVADASGGPTFPALFFSSRSNTKVWDFPVLLKYRIGSRRLRPFVGAGYTVSHRTTGVTSSEFCVSSAAVCEGSSLPFFQGTTRGSFSENSG